VKGRDARQMRDGSLESRGEAVVVEGALSHKDGKLAVGASPGLADDVPDRDVVRRELDRDALGRAASELDVLEAAEDLGRLASRGGEAEVELRHGARLGRHVAALVGDVERDRDPGRVEPAKVRARLGQ